MKCHTRTVGVEDVPPKRHTPPTKHISRSFQIGSGSGRTARGGAVGPRVAVGGGGGAGWAELTVGVLEDATGTPGGGDNEACNVGPDTAGETYKFVGLAVGRRVC